MSLNVTGKCQVYRIEEKNNFVTATLRTARKNQQGEWESEFFNAKFVGIAGAGAKGLKDKDKITIKNAVLENKKWNDKQYISVVVFEYEMGEQNEGIQSGDSAGDLPF